MSRLGERFRARREADRCALIPYITAGDPDPATTVDLMHAMVDAGADILELGVPFSDPMADGPVIQAACERALKHAMSLRGVLDLVAEFRARDADTPVVLMGYQNPIEAMGCDDFATRAAAAGVDGVLTVDLPPEEADGIRAAFENHRIDPVFLLAPTSGSARIARICAAARGFVYYVSLKGVTGGAAFDIQSVRHKLEAIRQLTDLPIGVGFGIKDAARAAEVARLADAVVVGSAIVDRIAANLDDKAAMRREIETLLGGMRKAMDARTQDERVA